jgi:hypothetical protein
MGSARESSRQPTGSCFGPEVRFGAVGSQSDVFQSQVVVHRVSQFLFASQIMLGRLNGHMPKQELTAFQWACGVGAFINSTNILLNLASSKSIWISTSCAPSFGLSFSTHVSVLP